MTNLRAAGGVAGLIAACAFLIGCQGNPPPSPAPTTTVATSAPIGTQVGNAAESPTSPPMTPYPALDPSWAQRPFVRCGADGLAFPSLLMDVPGRAELETDPAAVALQRLLAEPDAPEMPYPSGGWRRVLQSAQSAIFLAPIGGESGWMVAAFQITGGQWTLDLTGPCQPEVAYPPGVGAATWTVDPNAMPSPQDLNVTLIATERACAGGKPPGDRVLAPLVALGSQAIGITAIVRNAPGAQDCPGNPTFPLTVTIGEPIGGRALLDGSTFPPTRRFP